MATMIIRNDVLRACHIEGDPDLAGAIRDLSPDESLVLRIEGRPMRFRKLREDAAGSPADGVAPEPADAASWRQMQARRGSMIKVELEMPRADPYLLSLSATLTEWNSPEDAGRLRWALTAMMS